MIHIRAFTFVIRFLFIGAVLATFNVSSEVLKTEQITDKTVTFKKNKPNQRFVYEVFYTGISIGEMKQEYRWQGTDVLVNSAADFSFMLFSFGGSQQSKLEWNVDKGLFFSRNFQRTSEGFSTVKMTAEFDELGHNTNIINNGEKSNFTNDEGQVVDFNAINLQISEGLKKGQTHFEFYMQTSKDIAHYFFEVKGKEKVTTRLGEIEAYRVQQTRKNDRTFIAWFAPVFDHQMVKFEYQRRILDIEGELTGYSTDF